MVRERNDAGTAGAATEDVDKEPAPTDIVHFPSSFVLFRSLIHTTIYMAFSHGNTFELKFYII